MAKRVWGKGSRVLALVCLLMTLTQGSSAQTVSAMPKLDLNDFTGTWYEIARLPNKREKRCLGNAFALIATGDKPRQLQLVNSCITKNGFPNVRNGSIRAQDKSGDGRLKVSYLWPFSTKFWVLALGPENAWSLVGSPNHKELWIFARTTGLKPEVLAEIEQKAAAEGFSSDKLVMVPQSARLPQTATASPGKP